MKNFDPVCSNKLKMIQLLTNRTQEDGQRQTNNRSPE